MAYTRHTWQSGEVISSALLNNIEDGIEEAASSGGGGSERFIIECTPEVGTSDRLTHNVTLQEAHDAFESGKEIYIKLQTDPCIYIHLLCCEELKSLESNQTNYMFFGVSFKQKGYDLFIFEKDNEVTQVEYTIKPEPIIFSIAVDSASGDVKNVTCNYFYGQIKEMSQNPTMPLTATTIMINDDGIVSTRSGYSIDVFPEDNYITFSRIAHSGVNLINYIITYNSDGSITFSSSTIMTNENGGR